MVFFGFTEVNRPIHRMDRPGRCGPDRDPLESPKYKLRVKRCPCSSFLLGNCSGRNSEVPAAACNSMLQCSDTAARCFPWPFNIHCNTDGKLVRISAAECQAPCCGGWGQATGPQPRYPQLRTMQSLIVHNSAELPFCCEKLCAIPRWRSTGSKPCRCQLHRGRRPEVWHDAGAVDVCAARRSIPPDLQQAIMKLFERLRSDLMKDRLRNQQTARMMHANRRLQSAVGRSQKLGRHLECRYSSL